MKTQNIIFSLLVIILSCISTEIANAQPPAAFTYQATVRNSSGGLIANQAVAFRIGIIKTFPGGPLMYEEIHNITTTDLGLATFYIGLGTTTQGSIDSINWAADNYFIRIELDEQGGTNFDAIGISPLASVPYALHAKTAGNVKTYLPGTGITISNDTIHSLWQVNGNTVFIDNKNVGIGSSVAQQKLDVDGAIKVGNTTDDINGTIRYNGTDLEGYANYGWSSLTQTKYQTKLGGSFNSNVRNDYVYSPDSFIVEESGYYFVTLNLNGYNNATYTTPLTDFDYTGTATLSVLRSGTYLNFTPAIPFFQTYDDIGYGVSYLRYMPYNASTFVVYPFQAGDVVKLSAYVYATSSTPNSNWGITNYFVSILKLKN
jgi:trimeric autotransporter adhesin